jgi:prophage maintenance system killer protein
MNNEIILFENQKVKLEVNMKDETVWLNAQQKAKLFDRDYKTIRKHINNVLIEELNNEEVVAKFANTTLHGAINGKTQTHFIDYYNLDMIISVGYRVKSKNGIIFRKWANSILKDYMLKGYAINQKRLDYLEKTVKLLDIANRGYDNTNADDSKELLRVITEYTKALDLLDDYDHKTIKKIRGKTSKKVITYESCIDIIDTLRFSEESKLFAVERNKGLDAIIGSIYQTFDGKDVYSTVEEKASNFLYMLVKNHSFLDGNKRIAATLFIYFLQFYNLLYRDKIQIIDNNTLVALTLLIAESNPREKDIMIDLIMNFLC